MNPSENPKFEQEWQRLFESASETPPLSAWEAIEKHLDEKETVIIPLLVWWKNPKVLYAAAAAVVLLLLSWPLLRPDTAPPTGKLLKRGEVATQSSPSVADSVPVAGFGASGPVSEPLVIAKKTDNIQALPSSSDRVAVVKNSARALPEKAASFKKKNLRTENNSLIAGLTPDRAQTPTPLVQGNNPTVIATEENAFANSPNLIVQTNSSRKNVNVEADPIITDSSSAPLRTPALTRSIASLSPIGPSEQDVYMQKRYVFYRYEAAEPELIKRSRSRELWAGLGIMPASFNPQVNVTSSPVAFTNANASRQALASTSKARLSYALQMQGGKKLSKRWSVETGLSYLQGNSTFESDGYVLNSFTSRSTNVLEDALLSNNSYSNSAVQQPGLTPSFDKNAGSYIDLDQRTSNNYRYVQVPVQAGYALNPDGKMNYTVLAGVVGNLFLQNEIQSAQGYNFKNTADDGLYRSLNWSAATGVRVNYRMSNHWNASLTGSYQKAIASILRDNPTLESRPRLYGMAWGVQYIF